MSCSQLLIGDSNIITEIDAIKSSSIDADYIDEAISNVKTEINESMTKSNVFTSSLCNTISCCATSWSNTSISSWCFSLGLIFIRNNNSIRKTFLQVQI